MDVLAPAEGHPTRLSKEQQHQCKKHSLDLGIQKLKGEMTQIQR